MKGAGQTRPPVDAASLVIVDREGPVPRFLMGKRHPNHRFMPSVFVFPGGRADTSDTHIPDSGALNAQTQALLLARMSKPSLARARRLALAAVRETFEETGIVIGQPAHGTRAMRQPWSEFFATGYLPDLSNLEYFARAITPPRRTKRFDTRFFIVDSRAIRHTLPDVVTSESELTELAWLTVDDTVPLPLPAITRVILREIGQRLDAERSGRQPEIPFFFERYGRMQRELIAQTL
ncbi:MutT NTP pyrophosphohydrolases including oxidative damage repair enzymes [Rhabdaerophilaceae bacterium]